MTEERRGNIYIGSEERQTMTHRAREVRDQALPDHSRETNETSGIDLTQRSEGRNVERATLLLTFIDTYTYFPYLCTEYPHISTDSFLSVRGRFSPQCFAPDTEVRHLVTFFYLVLTYYLVCL